jgi:hypothetical protein
MVSGTNIPNNGIGESAPLTPQEQQLLSAFRTQDCEALRQSVNSMCHDDGLNLVWSDPQFDEKDAVKPPLSDDFKAFITADIRAKQTADEAERRDPNLRVMMVELVAGLGDLIENAAIRLAGQKGDKSRFASDHAADLLVWALTEYLAQGYFPRGEADNVILQGYQVDAEHAQDFFNVGIPATGGQPFAIEGQVQS